MKNITLAAAYLRTSSATNVGGDSDQRQREAVHRYAATAGLEIVQEFYDAAVSGADPVDTRGGFTDMIAFCQEQGITTVVVETASRFARDLMVQEIGLQTLKAQGIRLIAADSPDTFTGDDPMVQAIRQMLGVMAQLEKAMLVAKLKGARDRKSAQLGKRVEGRKGYAETSPDLVREAKRLARKNPKTGKVRSLRQISSELSALGYVTTANTPFSATQIKRLINP